MSDEYGAGGRALSPEAAGAGADAVSAPGAPLGAPAHSTLSIGTGCSSTKRRKSSFLSPGITLPSLSVAWSVTSTRVTVTNSWTGVGEGCWARATEPIDTGGRERERERCVLVRRDLRDIGPR